MEIKTKFFFFLINKQDRVEYINLINLREDHHLKKAVQHCFKNLYYTILFMQLKNFIIDDSTCDD